MIEFLVVLAALFFFRRAIMWLGLRLAAFAIGFTLGWSLLDRRS